MALQALSNPSQLVLRNQDLFQQSHLLVIGLPADTLMSELLNGGVEKISILSKDKADYDALVAMQQRDPERVSILFDSVITVEQAVDGVLLFLQKSKPLMLFWLQMILSQLPAEALLYVVGDKDTGIKSWKKKLAELFAEVRVMDNARHCVLYEAMTAKAAITDFDQNDYWQSFVVNEMQTPVTICSLPGVFSHGRLDKGTKVLLEAMQGDKQPPQGNVLDFGCGAGVISACLHQLAGKRRYTLLDCDSLALQSSAKTMTSLNDAKFSVLASDGLAQLTEQYDCIISNPPFHQGVKTHYEVTELFLNRAVHHLKTNGELWVVANSFLRYPLIIERTFGNCETLLVQDGFSIYRAVKRR